MSIATKAPAAALVTMDLKQASLCVPDGIVISELQKPRAMHLGFEFFASGRMLATCGRMLATSVSRMQQAAWRQSHYKHM